MAKTRDELLTTPKGQIVGKHQLYALLVDDAGVAILDAAGNEQVIEIKAGTDGKIQTSSTVVGSLPKSEMEGYGAGTTLRPLVANVPIGYIWVDVTNQVFYQSDGVNWVVAL